MCLLFSSGIMLCFSVVAEWKSHVGLTAFIYQQLSEYVGKLIRRFFVTECRTILAYSP